MHHTPCCTSCLHFLAPSSPVSVVLQWQALRFGNSRSQLEEAINIAFATGPSPREAACSEALRTLGMAVPEFCGGLGALPQAQNQPSRVTAHGETVHVAGSEPPIAAPADPAANALKQKTYEQELYKGVTFAWEELDLARNK
jgi:hypothetical protein